MPGRKRDGIYTCDQRAADRVLRFFDLFLTHSKGRWAGQPFDLAQWQADATTDLFAWKRADGRRRYRGAYIEVPRKNGKTTWVAGLGLYLFGFDDEPGAEVYTCAGDRAQARISFRDAKAMVEASADLRQRIRVMANVMEGPQGSVFRCLSADADLQHGLNVHACLFDELHTQPSRDLWDVMKTGMGARRQPMMIAMTTAGVDRDSICWEVHEYARAVQSGEIADPTFLPVIYAAEEDDPWDQEETWRKANPNLGVTIGLDFLKDEAVEAAAVPAKENTFRRLYLNQWVEQVTRWITMASWNACADPSLRLADFVGRPCYAAADVSSTSDLMALALAFPPLDPEPDPDADPPPDSADGGALERFAVFCWFWVPGDSAEEKYRQDRVPYPAWIRQGLVQGTDGAANDPSAVREMILGLVDAGFQIQEVAVDPWNGHQLLIDLEGEGLTAFSHRQGFASLNEPSKAFETKVLERSLVHGGHPVLDWNVRNLAVETDPAGNIKPTKQHGSGRKGSKLKRRRIDGAVAVIMALGRAVLHNEARGRSKYERGGMIWLEPDAEDVETTK